MLLTHYMSARDIADCAKELNCELHEVHDRLLANIKMNERIAERAEYEDPYGYSRNAAKRRPISTRGL